MKDETRHDSKNAENHTYGGLLPDKSNKGALTAKCSFT